jgi:hypothetical protein
MARSLVLAVFSALALVACVSPAPAPPKSTLKSKIPFTVRLGHGLGKTKASGGLHNVIAADRARIAHVQSEAAARKGGIHVGAFAGGEKHARASRPVNATNSVVSPVPVLILG